jgi:lipopolysaccharide/colanic/teichoic acid biosynthesis glycosyltransferase
MVWGLTARDLHDAYWHSRGVQCIRRGERQTLQRDAEIYLLLESGDLVLFNIAEMSERLTWHSAKVTRLRLIDEHEQRYSEHVVLDEQGLVLRIERRYRPRVEGSSRVMLTSCRRAAQIWMAARTRREGWDRVRRSVAWSLVDHWKCSGETYRGGDAASERRLIDDLVARWPHPDQALAGIQEFEPGVWHASGETIAPGSVRVGPLWVGRGAGVEAGACLVGPSWMEDCRTGERWSKRTATVRDIAEVEPMEIEEEAAPVPSPARAGRLYPFFKRMFDICFSACALLFGAPVMAAIAAAILLEDGGPIFFGHRRQGRDGTTFRCWKFRTMVPNAEQIVPNLQGLNQADGKHVNLKNDPRVTRVGRILRRTQMDELPQFWNVLIGQMSVVGPRPSPDDENQFCPAWRDSRLSVRPGITGLWQLKRTRRPGEDLQEWVKYDMQYVQHASFALDVAIIAATVKAMLLGRPDGASDETR